jgi:hypothetical protein
MGKQIFGNQYLYLLVGLAPGIDFINLHFVGKLFGQIFILKFWTNFYPQILEKSPPKNNIYVYLNLSEYYGQ